MESRSARALGRFQLTSARHGLLVVIGRWSFRHPWLLLSIALTGIVVSLGIARTRLTLETDWLVLFSKEEPVVQSLEFWRQNLPGGKDMAVIVSGGDLAARQKAVDALGHRLAAQSQALRAPLSSLDAATFLESGLYYLPEDQLERIDSDVKALIEGVPVTHKDLPVRVEELTSAMIAGDASAELVLRFLQAVELSTRPEPGKSQYWPTIEPESPKMREVLDTFSGESSQRVYLSLDKGQTLLVLVGPKLGAGRPEEAFGPAVSAVRSVLREIREQFPHLSFLLTGEPVLVVDERATIAGDTVLSTSCSVMLVILLFLFGYREVTRPALAFASLVVGLGWTLGAVSLTVGHLNFISVTYVPILVGIGIDFGIHISFRYYECRRRGCDGLEAIEITMATAGHYTLIAALTNCVPFAILAVIGFRGVAELGMIAMLGVMLCQLSACSVMPALLGILESNGVTLSNRGRQDLTSWYLAFKPWHGAALSLAVITTLLGLVGAPRAKFDIHLLKMQNPRLESVRTELMLVASGKSSVLTALVPAADLEQAREFEERLRRLPSVAEVIALSTFLPKVEQSKEKLVGSLLASRSRLLAILGQISGVPTLDAERALKLFSELRDLSPSRPVSQRILLVREQLEQRLNTRGPGPVIDGVNRLLTEMESKVGEVTELLAVQKVRPLRVDDLPEELKGRLRGADGTYVLRVFPKHDIWQAENLHSFLADLRTVSPNVTGEPVLIELFERVVLRTHHRGAFLSLLAMVALLALVLRDPRLVALASLPTAVSLVQVLGFMGFTGMTFNPANFVAIPMLLGIGSVFGLQSVLRMKELGNDELLCCSTGLAIFLSAATTAAGFASLMLAAHRGIASLGGLVTLGLVENALLSLLVLPCLVERWPGLVCRNR